MSIIYNALKKREKEQEQEQIPPLTETQRARVAADRSRHRIQAIVGTLLVVFALGGVAFLFYHLGGRAKTSEIAAAAVQPPHNTNNSPPVTPPPARVQTSGALPQKEYFDVVVPENVVKDVIRDMNETKETEEVTPVSKFKKALIKGDFSGAEETLLDALGREPRNRSLQLALLRYYMEFDRFIEADQLAGKMTDDGFINYELETIKRRINGEKEKGKVYEFPEILVSSLHGDLKYNGNPATKLAAVSQGDMIELGEGASLEGEVLGGKIRISGPATFTLGTISRENEGLKRKSEMKVMIAFGSIKFFFPPFGTDTKFELEWTEGVFRTRSATGHISIERDGSAEVGVVFGHGRVMGKNINSSVIDLPRGMYTKILPGGTGSGLKRIDPLVLTGWGFNPDGGW